jgi:hypothetical protein
MTISEAYKILNVSLDADKYSIKKQYYKLSLKYHPDKSGDTGEEFIKIQQAYELLTDESGVSNITSDYDVLFEKFAEMQNFLKGTSLSKLWDATKNLIRSGNIQCELVRCAIESMDVKFCVNLYIFILRNSEVLHINAETLEMLKTYIELHATNKPQQMIILKVSMDDLFEDNIYVLSHNNKKYYIPLWHDELIYEEDDVDLLVKCMFSLNDNVHVDENNNIHVHLKHNFTDVLKNDGLKFELGKKVFELSGDVIKVKRNQQIVLEKKGISKINPESIFETCNKSDVIIYLELF